MATTVQSILQEYFEEFAQNHPLSLEQRLAAERMGDCRTPALGGHVVGCPEGHVRTIRCNSCRHRNCPLCSCFAREKWLAAWKERLLDCPHHHIVFTLPHELNPLWRYNKREFGNTLFRVRDRGAAGTAGRSEVPGRGTRYAGGPAHLGPHAADPSAPGRDGHGRRSGRRGHLAGTAEGLPAASPGADAGVSRQNAGPLLKALEQDRLTLPPDTTLTAQKNLLNRLGRETCGGFRGQVLRKLGEMRSGEGLARTFFVANHWRRDAGGIG